MRFHLGQWTRFYSSGGNSGSGKSVSSDIMSELLGKAEGGASRSMFRTRPGPLAPGSGAGRGRYTDELLERSVAPPPRTGVYAGRSVAVNQAEDLPRAAAQLAQINRINKVREVKNLQRYHERPGKARLRIRMARKRREFRAGMRVLFHLALQAQKRGL